jgi:hypothetical protein
MSWLLLAPGLFVVDQLLLHAERKGWIYYRHRGATGGGVAGAAFGPVFDVLHPSSAIVVEERRAQEQRRDEEGDAQRRLPQEDDRLCSPK